MADSARPNIESVDVKSNKKTKKTKNKVNWQIVVSIASILLSFVTLANTILVGFKTNDIEQVKVSIEKEMKANEEKKTNIQDAEFRLKIFEALSKFLSDNQDKPQNIYMSDVIMKLTLPADIYAGVAKTVTTVNLLDAIDKNVKVTIYCKNKDRADTLASILLTKRYTNVWISSENEKEGPALIYKNIGYDSLKSHILALAKAQSPRIVPSNLFENSQSSEQIEIYLPEKG